MPIKNGAEVLAKTIHSYRLHFSNEAELQAGVAAVLSKSGRTFVREYDLGEQGRIDFFVPGVRVGIETKVKGSPSQVLEQVMGYAQHDAIQSLLVITSRKRAAAMVPKELAGKPVVVLELWSSAF